MKKLAITFLLISLTGMALFAEGTQEEQTWEPGMGRGYISEDQANWGPGAKGSGYVDQSYWNRRQMPMNNGYSNQDFRGRASLPMKGSMNTNQGTWGPEGMGYTNQNFNAESMTLTGKIDLTDVNMPKLTVGDDTYELMIPYRLDYDIDVKDGDEITISGFEVPGYRRTTDTELTNIMVTGATFDGTEYNLDMMNNGPVNYGRGADMMNNYGPANGRRGKSGGFNNNNFPNNSRNRGPQPNNMMHRPYGRR